MFEQQSQSCKKLNRTIIHLFMCFILTFSFDVTFLKSTSSPIKPTNNKIPSISLFHFFKIFLTLSNCLRCFYFPLEIIKDLAPVVLCCVQISSYRNYMFCEMHALCSKMICGVYVFRLSADVLQLVPYSLTLWQDKHVADVGTNCSLLFILNWKFLPRNVTETSELINSSTNLLQIMFWTC